MPIPQTIEALIEEVRHLEQKIDAELEKRQEPFRYQIKKGKVIFEKELLARQKLFKKNLFTYLSEVPLLSFLVSPVIYSIIIPAVILDIFATLYHAVCFSVYKIPKVRRSDYIIFDRHKLGYLNLLEKMNCLYCGYINGLVAYAQEIAARTEQRFCPISHAKKPHQTHSRYRYFFSYGDGERYKEELVQLRLKYEDLQQREKKEDEADEAF